MGCVVSVETLAERLEPFRHQVIVSTNGCFDLLHVGHLRYLQAARAMGDLLVVALNSDASVRRLKGPERPLVPEEERAELLAGLSCVDFVVLFEEETPANLLRIIRPNLHVKGAQYNAETLPEAPLLQELGAKIRWAPMVAGRSTTDLVERIRASVSV